VQDGAGTSASAVRVLVVADTHLGPGQSGWLIDELTDELSATDVILHAGDVTDASVLDAFGAFAPVHAVKGNNDRTLALPERLIVELGGCRVALVHDSGPADGRQARLRRWFPDADLVVFGHSHLPWHTVDVRSRDVRSGDVRSRDVRSGDVRTGGGDTQHQLNPGSAVQRRRARHRTVARVELVDRTVRSVVHVPLIGSPTGATGSSRTSG
jgi:putative phosphoesterase